MWGYTDWFRLMTCAPLDQTPRSLTERDNPAKSGADSPSPGPQAARGEVKLKVDQESMLLIDFFYDLGQVRYVPAEEEAGMG